MKNIYFLSLALTLTLIGAGCTTSTITPPATTEQPIFTDTTTIPAGWQTYTDDVRGFTLSYPATSPSDITSTPVKLPDAAGAKERNLIIHVSAPWKASVDSDGCLANPNGLAQKKLLQINGIAVCLTTVSDAGAGHALSTYHYTVKVKADEVADINLSIYYPISNRVYAGCETDADQTKQQCIDLAFDEARDTALFTQIMDTLKLL